MTNILLITIIIILLGGGGFILDLVGLGLVLAFILSIVALVLGIGVFVYNAVTWEQGIIFFIGLLIFLGLIGWLLDAYDNRQKIKELLIKFGIKNLIILLTIISYTAICIILFDVGFSLMGIISILFFGSCVILGYKRKDYFSIIAGFIFVSGGLFFTVLSLYANGLKELIIVIPFSILSIIFFKKLLSTSDKMVTANKEIHPTNWKTTLIYGLVPGLGIILAHLVSHLIK